MVLTVLDCRNEIEDALGGPMGQARSPVRLVNRAGRFLCSVHPWKFLERPQAKLNLRAQVSFSAGDWTQSTKTLTKTGAFANYAHLAGDTIDITAGTGLTLGTAKVVSRTSDDAIVLDTDLGADTAGTVSADSVWGLAAVGLPADFARLIAIDATNSLVDSIDMTTFSELLELRTDVVSVTSFNFVAAIAHGQALTGSAPVLRLELWPKPTTNEVGKLSLFYRAKWQDVATDTDRLPLPDHVEPLFVEIVREYALGYEEHDRGSVNMRLRQLVARDSPLMMAAKAADDGIQDMFGPLRGGAMYGGTRVLDWGANTTVGGPS